MGYLFLLSYYKKNYSKLIFNVKKTLSKNNLAIMYIYDTMYEFSNFKNNFGFYFMFFIRSQDLINNPNIDFTVDTEDKLINISSDLWIGKKGVFTKRSTNCDGVYGELFLDFYIRVIKNFDLLITYVSRKDFNSKTEFRGYDNVGYLIAEDKIELVISEAKFVDSLSKAKNSLLEDINGSIYKNSHLSKEYFNNFMSFIIEKNSFTNKENAKTINAFIYEINYILDISDKKFLDIMIEKDIKLNFIFFAIYQDKRKEPSLIELIYNELINHAKNQIIQMGIRNFSVEVVFIPTKNNSIDIKEEIDTFYE